MFGKDSQLN